jgi:hypothetical protein
MSSISISLITKQSGAKLPTGTFMQVIHDQYATDGLLRIGMPSVLSMYLNKYTELNSAWQWFWFRQMIHSFTNYAHWDENKLTPTELNLLKAEWRSLTKHSEAFTNFKGTDIFHDYITPNQISGTPGQEPLVCTGNIYKILGIRARLAGDWWIPVETLDGTKAPPPIEKINRLTRPDLIFCATNSPADKSDPKNWKPIILPDGRFRVDPFPQLAPKDTPVPLRTNGNEANSMKDIAEVFGTYNKDGVDYAVNYIRENRLKFFDGTKVPTPYIP